MISNINKPSCPCCSFDLFLPESEKQSTSLSNTVQHGSVDYDETIDQGNIKDLPVEIADVRSLLLESLSDNDDTSPVTTKLTIVDTHGHAQLNRDRDATYDLSDDPKHDHENVCVKSLVCSVEPADFQATLDYASQSDYVLPGLGVHPWYLESLPKDTDSWLDELEKLLLQHPSCIVGEIGLCKVARWVRTYPDGKAAAMAFQRDVFQKQMELAAKLQRPVSVHCVNAHGIFVSVMKELAQQKPTARLPPAIAMHSFTGTAHHVKELIDLERMIRQASPSLSAPQGINENNHPDPLFYFGFSHTVNYAMCNSEKSRRKGQEAVAAVPLDRLMVESDVACAQDVLGGTIGAVAYVASARHMSPIDVVKVTARNGLKFLGHFSDSKGVVGCN